MKPFRGSDVGRGGRVGARGAAELGVAALALVLGAASGCGSGSSEDGVPAGGSAGSAAANAGGSGGSAAASAGGSGGTTGGSGSGASGTSGAAGKGGGSGGSGASGKGGSGTGGGGSGTGGGGAGGASNGGSAGAGSDGGGSGGTGGGAPGTGSAADAAKKLGRTPNFLIGMGNDLDNDHNQDGAYTLGVTLDIHYAYLVGLPGEGGWPDWNAGGTFVNILTDSADAHGVTPMFDLYTMASRGEANLDPLVDDVFMGKYWDTLELLYERLAEFDKPAIVHFEPDFWAFAQQQANADPSSIPVHVTTLVSECDDLTDDLAGLGKCMIRLGRMMAPKVLLGLHASLWAGPRSEMVSFLNGVGAGDADFIGMDLLDRDAGCFEEHVDPNCQRDDGPWYWDESNQTSPNFHEYLAASKELSDGLGVPIIWWQIPFGVPSDAPGGTAGHYRDNRVHYLFNHVDELIDAGGLAAVFGVGAGNQTYITTDGGQFRDAVTQYFASPMPLP